jgi:hypothetical protein
LVDSELPNFISDEKLEKAPIKQAQIIALVQNEVDPTIDFKAADFGLTTP